MWNALDRCEFEWLTNVWLAAVVLQVRDREGTYTVAATNGEDWDVYDAEEQDLRDVPAARTPCTRRIADFGPKSLATTPPELTGQPNREAHAWTPPAVVASRTLPAGFADGDCDGLG